MPHFVKDKRKMTNQRYLYIDEHNLHHEIDRLINYGSTVLRGNNIQYAQVMYFATHAKK